MLMSVFCFFDLTVSHTTAPEDGKGVAPKFYQAAERP